jgi:hypothetical protein
MVVDFFYLQSSAPNICMYCFSFLSDLVQQKFAFFYSESEEHESDKRDPHVRTDEKSGQKQPCSNIR